MLLHFSSITIFLYLCSMIVCIAEKPSVAAEIARVVGAQQRRDGYFEGNGYQVTWTFGHLCTLKEPHDYDSTLRRWDLSTLPIIPARFGVKLISNKGVDKQFAIIERLVRSATEVVNCGDAGQEGELIQRWVLHKAKCQCPVKRLWISSLTDEAIAEGFQTLHDSSRYDRLYQAGASRAIGDWLLGINATRLYTLRYAQPKQVLSIGRVQTPTLALIVARQAEIDTFVPEPYWELKTTYRDVVFSAASGRFATKDEAAQVLSRIAHEPFIIKAVNAKNGIEAPPRLFDLTSLQVECNKKFGLSADITLRTIQSLYEKKLTSYPRVDTTYLSDDIYKKIPSILKGLVDYSTFVEPLLKDTIRKSKRVFDNSKVTDHHAIIPTGARAGNLFGPEADVYDLVCRRFIANFYPDSKVLTTTVEGEVASTPFKATGKQIVEPAWRVLFPQKQHQANPDDEANAIMPHFDVGESGPHKPDLQEKQTQPPKPYTEATLLRAMETAGKQVDDEELRDLMKDNGIGRPSTRAAIIETLLSRNYIRKERKNLLPTVTGVQLINTIKNDLLKSVELTGLWEKKLRQIEKGTYELDTFLAEMRQMVAEIVHTVKCDSASRRIESVLPVAPASKGSKASQSASADGAKEQGKTQSSAVAEPLICPRCKQAQLVKGKTAWGCSAYKEGCHTIIPFSFANKKLSEAQLRQLLKAGKTAVVKGVVIDGQTADGRIVLTDNFVLRFEPAEEKKLICPRCSSGYLIKGKAAWGCSAYRDGCTFRIPFEMYGKRLTSANMEQLVLRGKTGKLSGFKSPDGAVLSCRLKLSPDFNIEIEPVD